ncbi:MAG: hypothetical protein ACKODX_21230 [Gemmata sp.]
MKLLAAFAGTRTGGRHELLTDNGDSIKSHTLRYNGALRCPAPERCGGGDISADMFERLAK